MPDITKNILKPLHFREGGNPPAAKCGSHWIPAFAGMTIINRFLLQ
ncbi:MAG: hypothetical protein HQL69_16065 [Magnetococcales bacterium]|nr:hypothetical protein [Magnetococcales bacterium]